MKTRDAVLAYQEAQADTATFTKDIDSDDPLSALYIEVDCANGATSNKGNYISDIVSKVEVVDGSDVLSSLNMFELEAMYFAKTGKSPFMFPSEWASGNQRHGCHLLFGRYLWDRDFALLPGRFKNPQIKISFNKAAVRAAAADGFAAGTNIYLSVIEKFMEDIAGPAKFMMQKQIASFTAAASGDERVQLPADYPYRTLLLRAYEQGTDIDEAITTLKISCDMDKFIFMNRKVHQLHAEVALRLGRCEMKHDIFTYDNLAFRELNNKENSSNFTKWEDATGYMVNTQYEWSSEGKLRVRLHDGTALAADAKFTGKESGYALHSTLPFNFGLPDVPETWFDPTKYKKVEAVLTQGNAGAVCSIALEQVRPN